MQGINHKFRVRLQGLEKVPQPEHSPSLRSSYFHHSSSKVSLQESVQKLGLIVQDLANVIKNQISQKVQSTQLLKNNDNTSYPQSLINSLKNSKIDQKNLLLDEHFVDTSQKKSQNINLQEFTFPVNMQSRFKLVPIEIPFLADPKSSKQRRKIQMFQWLGHTCKLIFSVGFQLMLTGKLHSKTAKIYCSQNLLLRIIQLIKKNKLTEYQIEQINIFLKEQLLPYLELKYPQSENNQSNLRLANNLNKINNYLSNSNDFVYKSQVAFVYNQEGNYNAEIMSVLNYMINLANKVDYFQEIDELQGNQLKHKKQQQKSSQKGAKNSMNINQKISVCSIFQRDMEKLFKNVQNQKQVIRMKQKLSPSQYINKYQAKNCTQEDLTKMERYKEKVKQYTKYKIGRKVSESIPQFTSEEIKRGNLIVRNSQILRILNKWCNHLRDKFDNVQKIVLDRDQPFRMQDGSQSYLSKTHRILLKKLLKKEENKLNLFLNRVLENNYQFQSKTAQQEVPQQMRWYDKNQSTIGLFTAVLFNNNQNYIISYLNALIHSLMITTQNFNKIICMENKRKSKKGEYRKEYKIFQKIVEKVCNNNQSIEKLMEYIQQKQKSGLKNQESVPQLVTFRLGDLLRCKCSSKQTEITALYNEIMRISNSPSPLWKVIRIKNRLSQGTRDILINLNYRNQIIAEVQLQVDEAKSNFIMCSSSFKHYIYELRRAQFGPISQMANIWMNLDYRAQFFRQKYNIMNQRKLIQGKKHECKSSNKNSTEQYFPFVCAFCQKFWTKNNFIESHKHCHQCNKKICGYCQIQMDTSIVQPNIRAALKAQLNDDQKIVFQDQIIPNYGAFIALYDKGTIVRKFKKFSYEDHTYIFEIMDNDEYKLISEVTTKKLIKEFNQRHLVLDLEKLKKAKNRDNFKNENSLIAQKYFLPNQFKTLIEQKKISVYLQKKGIHNRDLSELVIAQQVLKVNLSENKISDFNLIVDKFPNVEIIVMPENDIVNISSKIMFLKDKLQYLDVNNNRIRNIPNQLTQLTKLQYLNISSNNIQKLPQNFVNLKSLKVLAAGYNNLSKMNQIPKSIKKLNLQHNNFSSFDIKGLQKIIVLNLSFNKITQIDGLDQPSTLKYLDLSNNKLKKFNIYNLQCLQYASFTFNQIQQVSIKFDDQTKSCLSNLNLSNNKIHHLKDEFYLNIQNVYTLALSNNPLRRITKGIFCLNNLEELDLSGINSKDKLQDNTLIDNEPFLPQQIYINLPNLQILDISNNQLKQIPQALSNIGTLKQLDLSSNQLTKIDIILTVQTLNVSTNKISAFTEQNAKNLTSLKNLNLSNNQKLEHNIDIPKIKTIIKNLNIDSLFSDNPQSQKSISSKGNKMKNNIKQNINILERKKIEKKRSVYTQQQNSQKKPKNILQENRIRSGVNKSKKLINEQIIIKEQSKQQTQRYNSQN